MQSKFDRRCRGDWRFLPMNGVTSVREWMKKLVGICSVMPSTLHVKSRGALQQDAR